jgi:hypothetical protein
MWRRGYAWREDKEKRLYRVLFRDGFPEEMFLFVVVGFHSGPCPVDACCYCLRRSVLFFCIPCLVHEESVCVY